jgi:hypothetical protein
VTDKTPKDAALADPPSSEAADSEHPHRTPGLGDALIDAPSKPQPATSGEPMSTGPKAFEPAVAAAIALWVIVGAGLAYGISQTVVKVAELFN